ncbi:Transcription initiation factor TFIID subunit 9 [Paecilomyces lecythidis]
MASPSQTQGSGPATQPLTPPADPPTNAASQANAAAPSSSQSTGQPTQVPATSLQDTGKSRRPRDARLIHMLLASQGVTAYQERVPLQLLDFAYRYTSSVLQDAVHLATEGYAGAITAPGESGSGSAARAGAEIQTVSLPALRLSIASRLHYQFQPGLPKEFLMDVAAERNRIALPGAQRGYDTNAAANRQNAYSSVMMGGMRLPPERFCLSGAGWNLKDSWESEGEEEVEEPSDAQNAEAKEEEEGEGEDEGDGKMEDIFGEDTAMGEGGEEDKTMTDV